MKKLLTGPTCMPKVFKLILPAAIFLYFLSFTTAQAYLVQEETLFDNGNIYTVYNKPTNQSVFTIANAYQVTYIETYHWNDRKGKSPGKISLKHSDGTIYGPWQASSRKGQWDVPNAYWFVSPYEVIKPGTYTIIDSDPSTWSQNSTSNNKGFAVVKGIRWYGSVTPGKGLGAINGRVTDLKFYEQPYEGVPYGQRAYSHFFEKQSTRYISYELHLEYTASEKLVEIPLTVRYYRPDGTLFTELDHSIKIQPGWTRSWHSWNTGWRNPGNWPPGQYTVKVYDGEHVISTGYFKVYADLNTADTLFNWLESVFPGILSPTGRPTIAADTVFYRYYAHTNVLIGTYLGDLYFLDPSGILYNLGSVNFWLSYINI